MWGDLSLHGSYFNCSYSNGFGYEYVSDYPLPQVLAYLLAYAAGLPVFIHAWKKQWMLLGLCGIILCAIGFVSFTIEASHWLWQHHLSLIASFPVIMIVLWAFWAAMAARTRSTKDQSGPEQQNT